MHFAHFVVHIIQRSLNEEKSFVRPIIMVPSFIKIVVHKVSNTDAIGFKLRLNLEHTTLSSCEILE